MFPTLFTKENRERVCKQWSQANQILQLKLTTIVHSIRLRNVSSTKSKRGSVCSWMILNLFEWLGWFSTYFLAVVIPRPLINLFGVLISRCEREDLMKFRVNSHSRWGIRIFFSSSSSFVWIFFWGSRILLVWDSNPLALSPLLH